MDDDSAAEQVAGCGFTGEELRCFHRYCGVDWAAAGLAGAGAGERIRHFVAAVEPGADAERLRAWLRTVGLDGDGDGDGDSGQPTEAAQLYERFERFDFAGAPGFEDLLPGVYASDDASRAGIAERMDRAKAAFYARHVEPLDYAAYCAFRAARAPAPVCPFQHLWAADAAPLDLARFGRVRTIDVGAAACLTPAALGRLCAAVREARSDRYHAAALVNAAGAAAEPAVFLPPLDCSAGAGPALAAAARLQAELRLLAHAKPVVAFADGAVAAGAAGILFAGAAPVVTTERFAVDVAAGSAPPLPLAALHGWAQLGRGVAEYALCHPDLVLRSAEWAALGLAAAAVAHRELPAAAARILQAASCPPPHTRAAVRMACAAEAAYPGPSRLQTWRAEIEQHFAPLADEGRGVAALAEALAGIDQPWAQQCVAVAADDAACSVADARLAGLRAVRQLEYSQALALEITAGAAWAAGERDPAVLFGGDA
ncbi:hypothetical protein H4R18_005474, partial [Coemansia javaensis]